MLSNLVRVDKKIIGLLNECLGNELIAINQYFLHARMFKNWGLEELDEHEYKKYPNWIGQ